MAESNTDARIKENLLEREKISERRSEGRRCSSCSAVSDHDALFCSECGTKLGTEKKACPVCGEQTDGSFCTFCGSSADGESCPSCGAVTYGDFCMSCGAAVTKYGREAAAPCAEPAEARAIMAEAEVESAKKELLSELTPDMKKEIERSRQRIILLKERAYAAERDERIDKYNNARSNISKEISKEELAFVKRSLERLALHVSSETKRVDALVEAREKEAEEKRKQEEERQRRIELINGSWIHVASWGYCIMKFTYDGSTLKGTTFLDCPKGQNLNRISGTFDGDMITFHVSGCSGNECVNHAIMKFTGKLTGNTISGHLNYMSDSEHGIFVRNG